jgi:hypothetical protein
VPYWIPDDQRRQFCIDEYAKKGIKLLLARTANRIDEAESREKGLTLVRVEVGWGWLARGILVILAGSHRSTIILISALGIFTSK